MPKQKEIKYWKDQIRRWEKSGLRKVDYCKKEGISPWTLGRWGTFFKQQHQKKTKISLVEVPINPATKMTGGNYSPEDWRELSVERPVTLVIDPSYRIELTGDFNPAMIKKLIRTVREIGIERNVSGPQIFPGGIR